MNGWRFPDRYAAGRLLGGRLKAYAGRAARCAGDPDSSPRTCGGFHDRTAATKVGRMRPIASRGMPVALSIPETPPCGCG